MLGTGIPEPQFLGWNPGPPPPTHLFTDYSACTPNQAPHQAVWIHLYSHQTLPTKTVVSGYHKWANATQQFRKLLISVRRGPNWTAESSYVHLRSRSGPFPLPQRANHEPEGCISPSLISLLFPLKSQTPFPWASQGVPSFFIGLPTNWHGWEIGSAVTCLSWTGFSVS